MQSNFIKKSQLKYITKSGGVSRSYTFSFGSNIESFAWNEKVCVNICLFKTKQNN
jgi:hypothetical protein